MAWEVGIISFLVMLLGTVIVMVNSVSFRCNERPALRTSFCSVCLCWGHCVGDHFLVLVTARARLLWKRHKAVDTLRAHSVETHAEENAAGRLDVELRLEDGLVVWPSNNLSQGQA